MVFSVFSYAGSEGEAGTSHRRARTQYGFTPEQLKWLEQEVEQMKAIGKSAFWSVIISNFNEHFQTFFLRDKESCARFAASYNNRYRGVEKKAYEAHYEELVEHFVWNFIVKDLEIQRTQLGQILSNEPQINWVLLVSIYMQGYNPRAVSRSFFKRDTAKAKVVERLQRQLQQETSEHTRVRVQTWIDFLTAKHDAQNVQNTQEIQAAEERQEIEQVRGVKRVFWQMDENQSGNAVTLEGELADPTPAYVSQSPRSYETYNGYKYDNEDEYRALIMRGTQEGPGVRLSQLQPNSLTASESPVLRIPSELMPPMSEDRQRCFK